ncbi:ribonuclease CL2-like [Colius striatus]|uniref:ribonuclease CL2-like n=1 Tax=Colius striatus TaxID=57412 RepID=UPI002B1D0335|nr:ribonuclease CL2-like [Colius striatus]XP_061849580.1 ribonuclease CL2-like [Colius striatus]XP_061849581.1 ribonuclease CL2-like [Colius striatus]XP_061849582.1 ribonuclease CL2-like [Colius striatus]XP_061849583.1 ribonuclease CL2-like [Colius striatus]
MAGWALYAALVLAALSGALGESRYEKFLRQHVDYPRTPVLAAHRYCENMLARRGVTAPGRPCKPSNTFVHASPEELSGACSAAADAAGLHSTAAALPLTACRLRGGDTRQPCAYRARQLQHHVRVACRDGLPVHLAGTRPPAP